MPQRIDALATKIAIRDMLHRYCRGLDRMDKQLALSVFHPDSVVDYDHMFTGTGPGFIDWVWIRHSGMARHSHNITNLYVEPGAERSASEAYVIVMLRVEGPDSVTVIQGVGRYLDQWVRHEGRWVIKRRRYIHEFGDRRVLATDDVPQALSSSRRDPSDPSYALTPELTFE